ncbi:hypothetical protein FB451DRAFT_1393893 [Mycena latifolia]|nr:hypothetical protein FB451DRAFT_1393893 [Mycena latifolia]
MEYIEGSDSADHRLNSASFDLPPLTRLIPLRVRYRYTPGRAEDEDEDEEGGVRAPILGRRDGEEETKLKEGIYNRARSSVLPGRGHTQLRIDGRRVAAHRRAAGYSRSAALWRSGTAEASARYAREEDLQFPDHTPSLSPEAVYNRARCTRIRASARLDGLRACTVVAVARGPAAAPDHTRARARRCTAERESPARLPTVVELPRESGHAGTSAALTASTHDLLAALSAHGTGAAPPSRTACAAPTCVRPREAQSVVRPLKAQTCVRPCEAQTCVSADKVCIFARLKSLFSYKYKRMACTCDSSKTRGHWFNRN